jgi:hypothetical protein
MKKLILIVLVMFSAPVLFAQNTDYEMWETMYMTPKLDQLTNLSANLAAHLEKFHQEAPNSASVWRVTTGPHTGKLVWIAGPMTFTDMDNELPEAHGEDWANNISPYLHSIEQGEFWVENKVHAYIPEGEVTRNKIQLTYLDIADGENYRFNAILKQIAATIKEIGGKDTWQVYNRKFWNNDGRDVAWTSLFEKWATYDDNDVFVETFKKLHGGDNSWDNFIEEWEDCVESAYQEHFVFATKMNPSE